MMPKKIRLLTGGPRIPGGPGGPRSPGSPYVIVEERKARLILMINNVNATTSLKCFYEADL